MQLGHVVRAVLREVHLQMLIPLLLLLRLWLVMGFPHLVLLVSTVYILAISLVAYQGICTLLLHLFLIGLA